MGCSCISTPPMLIRSVGFRAQISIWRPLTKVPPREPASEIVQLPSSYRVRTAWFRETVPRPKVISQDLLRPITVSQWVTGTWEPSERFSQAQISGSRRKVSRGRKQRISKRIVSTGRAYRRNPIYSDASTAVSAGRFARISATVFPPFLSILIIFNKMTHFTAYVK